MHRFKRLRVTIVGLALLAAVLPTSQVLAGWSYWNTYDDTEVVVNNTYWIYYGRARVVNYSPYGIWINEYAGPAVYGQWTYCNSHTGGGARYFDSTMSGTYLKLNYSPPSNRTFCLAFESAGASGSFTGELNWDGPSI